MSCMCWRCGGYRHEPDAWRERALAPREQVSTVSQVPAGEKAVSCGWFLAL